LLVLAEKPNFSFMNRIDRVSAILIQLQSRKIVKAQDIAVRFHISLRTVYRDIKTLEEAGVPIIGEAGVGYSIMDGYRLPPVMFTKEEATAFLTAGKLVEKFTDDSTNKNYVSAMDKVRAVLRSPEKNLLENMEDHIAVMQNYPPFETAAVSDLLPALLTSISIKQVMRIKYCANNSGETTERNIEPIGIFYASGYWHAIAYCQLRHDYRDFRADRITAMHATEKSFTGDHPSLKTYLNRITKQEKLDTIVINVKKEVAWHLHQLKYYYGFVNEKQVKDQVQMTFVTAYPEVFVRWFSMYADSAELVSPAFLSVLLQDYLKKIFEKFC
jgi:predicted DNA-binding transcriptional regulator YafY